ncbi:MAG: hypothetical protein Q8Q32_01750 [bacterium]|nr:hypothetical protein [bacterium]
MKNPFVWIIGLFLRMRKGKVSKHQELPSWNHDEFYSFNEVLERLSITENRLKRLVSEGEIRMFRFSGQACFRRGEIDNIVARKALDPSILGP